MQCVLIAYVPEFVWSFISLSLCLCLSSIVGKVMDKFIKANVTCKYLISFVLLKPSLIISMFFKSVVTPNVFVIAQAWRKLCFVELGRH